MASLVLSGDTSGSVTLAAPAVAGSTTQTLVAETGTLAPIVSGTAVASTSGTSVDFTGIPSWVKRITVMFSGVSTSGTSNWLVQIGSGSFSVSGYGASASSGATSVATTTSTAGFNIRSNAAADTLNGSMQLLNISGNVWASNHTLAASGGVFYLGAGNLSLGGTLDRVRITTVNGTDTFDAGTINILYE